MRKRRTQLMKSLLLAEHLQVRKNYWACLLREWIFSRSYFCSLFFGLGWGWESKNVNV